MREQAVSRPSVMNPCIFQFADEERDRKELRVRALVCEGLRFREVPDWRRVEKGKGGFVHQVCFFVFPILLLSKREEKGKKEIR